MKKIEIIQATLPTDFSLFSRTGILPSAFLAILALQTRKSLLAKWLFITLSLLLCMTAYAKPAGENLDQIVAVVNDDVVTTSELNHSLSLAKQQLSQEHANMPATATLKKQVLDQLINKKLQLQIAEQVGLHITDEDVDHIVQNLASKNNMSVDSLYKRINSEGLSTGEYRKELREQMTIQKLQQQQITSHIVVTPDEINTFMHSKPWQSNASKDYHLEDILVALADSPSADEIASAKKHAQSVMANMQQGIHQTDKQANITRNDLGWRKVAEIPSVFVEHLVDLKPNEIVGPIRAGNGFHILHLIADRSNTAAENTPSRKEIEQLLIQRKFQENVQNWVSKMRSQAFVTTNMKT